jgi:S-phase kinase-associated protein 1
MAEVVQEWYASFLDREADHLFDLVLAANYMEVQPLIDLTCASVAAAVKDKTKQELYAAFGITTDFTPEEEAKIRAENKWAEERGY